MNKKAYFHGQLKRISKLFPGIFALSVVFAVVIGISGFMYAKYTNYNKVISKYNIGVLCDRDNVLVSIGLGLIKSVDDSRFVINIYEYDDKEPGFDAIHNNDIKVFAVIPDNFVDDIMQRTGEPYIELYPASQKGITTVMMDEVVNMLSDDIILTASGLYTIRDELSYYNFPAKKQEYLKNLLMTSYMNALASRGNLTNLNEIGLGDGLSFIGFFFCGMVLFYTVMLSFCSISYFIGSRTEYFMICRAKGVRSMPQVFSEYICFFLSNLICGCFTLLCVFIIFKTGMLEVEDFSKNLIPIYIRFSLFYIFILIGLTSFEFLMFEVIRGIINKFLMAFLVLIGFSFLSGYFYPRTFLPEIANTIGRILPTGVAYDVLSSGITGNIDYIGIFKMIIYTVIFLVAVVFARKKRIEKGID